MSADMVLFYLKAKRLALIVLICCIPLVSAEEQLSNNTTESAGYTVSQQKPAAIDPILHYKLNKTFWQKKISSELLYIIDPNYPEMGNTREEIKEIWKKNNQLIYSAEVKNKLDVNQVMGKPVGDYVIVFIHFKSSISNQDNFPYVTNVASVNEAERRIAAWIDLNNIEKLATLNEVSWIELAEQLRTDTIIIQPVSSNSTSPAKDTIQLMQKPIVIDIPPSLVPRVTSAGVSSPLSIFNPCMAILISGIIGLVIRKKLKDHD